jgi:hypothetical protein
MKDLNTMNMTEVAKEVLDLAIEYFGPATEVFLQRQSKFHLNNVDFKNLKREHLPELAKWLRISGALIIDRLRAQELSERVNAMYYVK